MAQAGKLMLQIDNAEHVGKFHLAIRILAGRLQENPWDDELRLVHEMLVAASETMTAHLRNRGKK